MKGLTNTITGHLLAATAFQPSGVMTTPVACLSSR